MTYNQHYSSRKNYAKSHVIKLNFGNNCTDLWYIHQYLDHKIVLGNLGKKNIAIHIGVRVVEFLKYRIFIY